MLAGLISRRFTDDKYNRPLAVCIRVYFKLIYHINLSVETYPESYPDCLLGPSQGSELNILPNVIKCRFTALCT
jgi:hypothetical protein